jgi:hypothetical protein
MLSSSSYITWWSIIPRPTTRSPSHKNPLFPCLVIAMLSWIKGMFETALCSSSTLELVFIF